MDTCEFLFSFPYLIYLSVVSILLYTVCNKYWLQKWDKKEDMTDLTTRNMENR